ncbi:hypothetical protein L1987_32991 [Smallanthus sonchifolius]|uniref:Uncharacterized protein n=1 Tax=Smallanthus sonchifolius TaxID=185202 RepID=A0ACB9HQM5_9ASTR|nr:hypothetical protein L1987_32991 [Smallanthus sonchifolius]
MMVACMKIVSLKIYGNHSKRKTRMKVLFQRMHVNEADNIQKKEAENLEANGKDLDGYVLLEEEDDPDEEDSN